ncbi:RAD52 DNA repair protein [Hysterangium stoloniferum]|nr:RAD52 DNA repair protein [Hysterangium stoloniferum]
MSTFPPQMVYSGPMSYNAAFHGSNPFTSTMPSTPFLLDPSTLPPEPTFHDISVATHKQIASLQAKLDQKLGPEYVSQRPGPGGGPKLTYAEGWKIINLANEIFGFNGWSSSICSLTVDYLDPHDEGRRWNCGVSAIVRVTLKDGVYHEDAGYGVAENVKSKGTALEKCKKEAITDGIKRTLRNFGNLLGNCLYDKQYTQEIVKIKVQPAKFDRSALHRRPEFEEGRSGKLNVSGSSIATRNAESTSASAPTTPAIATRNTESKTMPPPPLPHFKDTSHRMQCKSEPATPENRCSAQPPPPVAATAIPRHLQSNHPSTTVDTPPAAVVSSHDTTTHNRGPSIDPEEASYFNSEDDALFMQLDMEGVGSMELEEDRPVDTEADYDLTVSTAIDSVQSVPARSDVQSHCHASSVAQKENQNQLGQLQDRASNQHQSREQLRIPRQQQQQKQQQHPQQRSTNQSNRPAHPSVASRSATPSTAVVGGFHFPPGMDLSSRPIPNNRDSESTYTTGMKRGADAMSHGTTTNQHRSSSNSTSNPDARIHSHPQNLKPSNGRPREPLAPLALDRGDVKRMRQ